MAENVADSLLKARMRRGGTASGALPRLPTLQMLKKMEEEETIEEEEDENEDGSSPDSDFGPLLGELLKIDWYGIVHWNWRKNIAFIPAYSPKMNLFGKFQLS